jgi:hypothetical protein
MRMQYQLKSSQRAALDRRALWGHIQDWFAIGLLIVGGVAFFAFLAFVVVVISVAAGS